jgi:cytochrome c-type biogenesis protein CcmH
MSDDRVVSRRAMLAAGLAAMCPGVVRASQQQNGTDDVPSARLPRPDMAGRPRAAVTDYENDPFIVGLESQLRCTCGCNLSVYTCRTTDFTCQTSPAMHQQVIALVEEGKTGEEILNAFVAQHGETVLMAPPKRGFNIAAYVVPGIAITTVGAAMLWVLGRRGWRMAPQAVSSSEAYAGAVGLSDEDAGRLRAELEELGS